MIYGMQRIQQNNRTMENKKTLYNSQTYNPLKAFLYAFPVYALLTGLLILIIRPLHMPGLGVVIWIVISIVPFLFQKRFKEVFTRNIELIFDNQSFIIQEYDIKNGGLIKQATIPWAEMEYFKCSFSSEVTYLTIGLRDGSTNNLSFKEEKTQEQIINEKSVFSVFYYYVRQYNSDKEPGDKIALKPGFLTTKSGAFVLFGVAILAVVAIVIHFVLAPKTFGLSFMSFFIIIGLLVKRKTDKDLYNKINQLEPRPPID